MKGTSDFSEIYLCREPVDFRCGLEGLIGLAEGVLRKNATSGALFAFVNRRKDRVRALYWDRTGFAVWQKRLERERFAWPTAGKASSIAVSPEELAWLLDGIDITKIARHSTLAYALTS